MSWFKVDDLLHGHPKARKAGLTSIGLWALSGSYCMAYKLDGHIDRDWVSSWPGGVKTANALAKAGLWHATGHDCPRCPQPADPIGWVFHDWDDVQPTADEIEKKREKDRARQRQRRSRLLAPTDVTQGGDAA